MSATPYLLIRTFSNIKGNLLSHLVTALTIAFVTTIFGASVLIYLNINRLSDNLSREFHIMAYLDRAMPEQDLAGLKTTVASLQEVARVQYVNSHDAFRRLAGQFQGENSLLSGLGQDFLPAGLEIELKEGRNNPAAFDQLALKLKHMKGVTDVRYGKDWVEKLEQIQGLTRLLVLTIGGLLLVSVIFIVSSTIKLTMYLRREELEIMRLMGATNFFIRGPFIIEGSLQGLAGSGMAVLALYTLFNFTLGQIRLPSFIRLFEPVFLPPSYSAGIIIGSIALCILGSFLSSRRFLRI